MKNRYLIMNTTKKKIGFSRLSKIDSPYKDDPRVIYHAIVNINNIPEGLPTEVNPRDVNINKKVYKKIVHGLVYDDRTFYANNRGILISAKHLSVDNLNSIITLDTGDTSEDDNAQYGVLDGGHTYHAIISHRKEVKSIDPVYVHLEIMTNIQDIDTIAAARNTSVQVSDKAIAELAEKFEFIKVAIKNESYSNDISYRENEDKRLDSVDLVKLLFAFNIYRYPKDSTTQPIPAYSGKAQVLKDYLESYGSSDNPYTKIAPLLPKITELYDTIEQDIGDAYRLNTKNGKFGKVKGVDSKTNGFKSKFYQKNMNYQISQGLIFPIISSFRALLEENNNNLEWAIDPITVWNKVKGKLVNNTIEMSRSLGNNPQSAGKNPSLWSQNYDAVNTSKLELQMAQLRALQNR